MDIKFTWNRTKILKNKWTKANVTSVTENLQNENQILTSLNKISPPWVPTDPTYFPDCNSNDFFDAQFDLIEFNIALNSRNSKSAPGLDGINYEVIKLLPMKYKLILLNIYNQMYTTSEYPLEWKLSYIHFIEKSDKKVFVQ